MALIECPECGRQVSDKALACPGCGCPIAEKGASEKPALIALQQTRTSGAEDFLITKQGSQSSFRLFSVDAENVNLECVGCGKVFTFKRSLFDYVDDEKCVAPTRIDCPNCNGRPYSVASHNERGYGSQPTRRSSPQVQEKKPMSFWSVVGAIIVAMLILAFF